jgi:electron transport complex protein RnfC
VSTPKKGIVLEQNKEPALSRGIRVYPKEDADFQRMETPPVSTPSLMAPHEIIRLAWAAQIVDETDGRRLYKKLAAAEKEAVSEIAVDALDDEPYISSQIGPALWLPDQLAEGIALASRATGAAEARIEIYRNLFDVEMKIPRKLGEVRIERINGTYPAEYRTIRRLRRKNALVIGACALIHLRRAAYENRAQSTCFVTLAGNCIANPGNYEVPIGTRVDELLAHSGLIDNPKRIILGGSMTGYCITDPSRAVVTPTTRGILAFHEDFQDYHFSCIGCGRCTEVCPENLAPYYIYKMIKAGRLGRLELFDVDRCVGCETCSYVCPAKLDISHVIIQAKKSLSEKRG